VPKTVGRIMFRSDGLVNLFVVVVKRGRRIKGIVVIKSPFSNDLGSCQATYERNTTCSQRRASFRSHGRLSYDRSRSQLG
jgi:hypothetical protein